MVAISKIGHKIHNSEMKYTKISEQVRNCHALRDNT